MERGHILPYSSFRAPPTDSSLRRVLSSLTSDPQNAIGSVELPGGSALSLLSAGAYLAQELLHAAGVAKNKQASKQTNKQTKNRAKDMFLHVLMEKTKEIFFLMYLKFLKNLS